MDPKAVNQCDLCLHLSSPSCSRISVSAPVCVGLYMLVAAVVLVTVCGNLLVIISICCFRHLHTPTNLILLSLAVADLLVGLTVMPFHFTLRLESCWRLGVFACKLLYVCCCVLSCVSIYSVVFIAVDRYFALHTPFLYASKMTMNLSLKTIYLIWVYSLNYSIVYLYFNGNFVIDADFVCVSECVAYVSEIWAYVDLICVFGVNCALIIILYSKIFALAKMHINAISKHRLQNNRQTNGAVVSEAKAALNLGIVVVVFLMCCVPYFIAVFISLKNRDAPLLDVVTNAITPVLLNSTVNPIIYALFYPWFQKCVKQILTFKFAFL